MRVGEVLARVGVGKAVSSKVGGGDEIFSTLIQIE
jgi:hypothetical protein